MSGNETEANTSHRQMLRASSIIGASSVLSILFGLARVKLAALVLGATGVGLIGLLQNILSVASVIGGLSLNIVGARHIAAAAAKGAAHLAHARLLLAIVVSTLALVTSVFFWLFRGSIASLVLGSASQGDLVGWLAVGVMFTIGLNYQTALLTGLRKMGDLARSAILSAALVTATAATAILTLGEGGIIVFILATPLCTFAVGHFFTRRHKLMGARFDGGRRDVVHLLRLGGAMTVAGTFSIVGQLLVRVLIERQLDLSAVGYFQAAWFISMTYLGFVLQALGTDFFPRLAQVTNDKISAIRLINEQTEVTLLLAAPIIAVMLALTPIIIGLLYTSEFSPAVNILRWQIMADLLKIVSWPLGLVLVAFSDGRRYVLAEVSTVLVLVGTTSMLLPSLGLEASGIAVLIMSIWYLPVIFLLVQRHIAFRWSRGNLRLFFLIALANSVIFALTLRFPAAASAFGVAIALAFTALALVRLENALPAPLATLSRAMRGAWQVRRK